MVLKSLFVGIVAALTLSPVFANEVYLKSAKPMTVTFKVAHKINGKRACFGASQKLNLATQALIPVDLLDFDKTGIIITSVNGHDLPPSANQFDRPRQCSLTTDRSKKKGTLTLILSAKAISCRVEGGIFGNGA